MANREEMRHLGVDGVALLAAYADSCVLGMLGQGEGVQPSPLYVGELIPSSTSICAFCKRPL